MQSRVHSLDSTFDRVSAPRHGEDFTLPSSPINSRNNPLASSSSSPIAARIYYRKNQRRRLIKYACTNFIHSHASGKSGKSGASKYTRSAVAAAAAVDVAAPCQSVGENETNRSANLTYQIAFERWQKIRRDFNPSHAGLLSSFEINADAATNRRSSLHLVREVLIVLASYL